MLKRVEGDSQEVSPEHSVALWQAIAARRPILADLMALHGETRLSDYAHHFLEYKGSTLHLKRQHELIETTRAIVADRLSPETARQVATQLASYPVVSTADHHGPIDHPFFVNANIISAMPYQTVRDAALRHLIVFSFASVSVNNASAYPRGILFHGNLESEPTLIRLPILPDKVKMGVVYGMRPFTAEELHRALEGVERKVQEGALDPDRGNRIRGILESVFGTEDVLSAPDFATQVTKINFRLWPSLFHDSQRQGSGVPDLIYVDIEELVTQLLLRHHLGNPASLLFRLLFDPALREKTAGHFNNIPGAFCLEHRTGTFLFWAVNEKHHRVGLELDGETLVNREHGITIPLTPDNIMSALKSKTIFPGMLLSYLTVPLYYGMKCLGGFSQVHDLTLMKRAWGTLLREIGETAEAEALGPVETDELGGDGMVLAYLPRKNGGWSPATGIDMAVSHRDTSYGHCVQLARTVTLREMMQPMLPEIYNVLYTGADRDPVLSSIRSEDMLRGSVLEETLRQTYAQPAPSSSPADFIDEGDGDEPDEPFQFNEPLSPVYVEAR